jgi:cellulose synthase operon protein YhjQ
MDAERVRTQEAAVEVQAPEVQAPGAQSPAAEMELPRAAMMPSALPAEAPLSAGEMRVEEPAAGTAPLPVLIPEAMADVSDQPPLFTGSVATDSFPDSFPDSLKDISAVAPSGSTSPHHRAPQWFALKGILGETGGRPARHERTPLPQAGRAPVMAVFSLAGGVGKSCMVATLGRTLSAQGERVLLVDTAAFSTLQFFFGSHDQRVGVLRTFTGPDAKSGLPVDLLTVDAEGVGLENNLAEPLTQEILRNARSANRILIDLATASGVTVRRILRMSPTVLVPVTPDVRSVASVGAIEAFFQRNPSCTGQSVAPLYVLNQFDEGRQLHRDVRAMLQSQLGERLVPVILHRAPAVSEALAEGMTVADYAPGSQIAKDYETLAEWTRAQFRPADHAYRGMRWSER